MGAAFKVMLLGDIGVGKTSLARRLSFDSFSATYKPTIGVEIYRHLLSDLGGDPVTLILWDTDGNFGDAVLRHVYIKQASAAVIVADRTRPETITRMLALGSGFAEMMPGRPMHFLLNKCDLPFAHGVETIFERLAVGGPLTETSALDGTNVARAFEDLAVAVKRRGY